MSLRNLTTQHPTCKIQQILAQLSENFVRLEKSMTALAFSYEKCDAIGKKAKYDLEEQESFEALTSRFARTSDITALFFDVLRYVPQLNGFDH